MGRELLKPSKEDLAIFSKYFSGKRDNADIITSLAMESGSRLDIGAALNVIGGSVNFNEYLSLNRAKTEEVISCLKVLMSIYPSNPTKYLDAVSRCLFTSDTDMLNKFFKESIRSYCYYPSEYSMPERCNKEKTIISNKNLLSAGQLSSLAEVMKPFVGALDYYCLSRLYSNSSIPMFVLEGEEGNFYIRNDKNHALGIIDPFSTHRFKPDWVCGFYECTNFDAKEYNILLI